MNQRINEPRKIELNRINGIELKKVCVGLAACLALGLLFSILHIHFQHVAQHHPFWASSRCQLGQLIWGRLRAKNIQRTNCICPPSVRFLQDPKALHVFRAVFYTLEQTHKHIEKYAACLGTSLEAKSADRMRHSSAFSLHRTIRAWKWL